jgi:hypothetical protein
MMAKVRNCAKCAAFWFATAKWPQLLIFTGLVPWQMRG